LLWIANTASGHDVRPGLRALAPCWVTLAIVVAIGALSPVPAFALHEGLRLLPVLLLATLSFDLLQRPEYRSRILSATVGAGFGATLLALLQAAGALPASFPSFAHYDQDMYSVFGNEGLLAGFLAIALTTLPGMRAVERGGWRRAVVIAIAPALMTTLLLTESRGGLAAALAGLTGLLLLRVLSIRTTVVMLLVTLVLVTSLNLSLGLAPWEKWLSLFSAEDTGGNLRRWILRASVGLAAENPLLGCGLGHYAYAIPIWLGSCAPVDGIGVNTLTTYHAHLDMLEWFCETGLVGVMGAAWIASRLRIRSGPALCGLLAALVFSMFHPAWYSAPHALVGFLLYVMNIKASPPPMTTVSPRYRALATGPLCIVFVFGGSVSFVTTDLIPSFLLRRAEDRHLAGVPATEDYVRAIDVWGFHPEAHESYGIYAYSQGEFGLALEQFYRARQGLDTGRIHQLCAMASVQLGNREGACRSYAQCAARWPWDSAIQARRAEYCGRGAGSGGDHGQKTVDPEQIPR
jgi:hypothetical protein